MSTATFRFDLTKYKNCRTSSGKAIKSFAMREVNGQDEETAANFAKAKGGSVTPAEEMVRLSITEVNGSPVKQPFLEFDTWNTRTRAFALQAFRNLNGTTEEETDAFLATAVPVDGSQGSGTADEPVTG